MPAQGFPARINPHWQLLSFHDMNVVGIRIVRQANPRLQANTGLVTSLLLAVGSLLPLSTAVSTQPQPVVAPQVVQVWQLPLRMVVLPQSGHIGVSSCTSDIDGWNRSLLP